MEVLTETGPFPGATYISVAGSCQSGAGRSHRLSRVKVERLFRASDINAQIAGRFPQVRFGDLFQAQVGVCADGAWSNDASVGFPSAIKARQKTQKNRNGNPGALGCRFGFIQMRA